MKAVIYARVSTEQQSEGSVEQQIRKCEEYCKFRDYEIVEIYTDVGSGMKIERPGYEEMMEKIEDWDICIAYKLDRFHRSSANASKWADMLNKAEKNFAAIDIEIDTVTAMGRFIFRLMSSLAQLEVEQTRERTKMGMEAVTHQGRKLGPPPYGYTSKFKRTGSNDDKGILEVNKAEAEIVKVIFDCSDKGFSPSEICEHLMTTGIPTKKGNKIWRSSTIDAILRKKNLYRGTYTTPDGEEKEYSWANIL
jgi:DNA invertase Pin-like site-specific DNA recombinase